MNEPCRLAMSFERSPSILEVEGFRNVNERTLLEIRDQFLEWLEKGLFPQDDFEYKVRPDGSIKIPADLRIINIHQAEDRQLEISELATWLEPFKIRGFLLGAHVHEQALPEELERLAQQIQYQIQFRFSELYGWTFEEY